MLRSSLIAPPVRSYENWIVIKPVGESWEDVNWDGIRHQTYVNQELGMFYRPLVTPTFYKNKILCK
jgi:hypothetical protein